MDVWSSSYDHRRSLGLGRSVAFFPVWSSSVQSGPVRSGPGFNFFPVQVIATGPGLIFSGPVRSGPGFIFVRSRFQNPVRVRNSGYHLSGPGRGTSLIYDYGWAIYVCMYIHVMIL